MLQLVYGRRGAVHERVVVLVATHVAADARLALLLLLLLLLLVRAVTTVMVVMVMVMGG